MSEPKYDVALSFLARDESIGAALADLLTEGGLEVFFFPRDQEVLAGTDGMESMRSSFIEGSRVAVVLFREPWGQTPWTRVEQTAIQESCLKLGWERLFFVALDQESALPLWLPPMLVRFNYADFPLEQAVGAFKARVQERGGVRAPLTPKKRAELLERENQYRFDTKQMGSEAGARLLNQKASELFAAIQMHCAEIEHRRLGIRVASEPERFDAAERSCVLTNGQVSLIVVWEQPFAGTLKDASLKVREFNRRMILPGEAQLMFFAQPQLLKETVYISALSRARIWVDSEVKAIAVSNPKHIGRKMRHSVPRFD
jgi:hypothetical protein